MSSGGCDPPPPHHLKAIRGKGRGRRRNVIS